MNNLEINILLENLFKEFNISTLDKINFDLIKNNKELLIIAFFSNYKNQEYLINNLDYEYINNVFTIEFLQHYYKFIKNIFEKEQSIPNYISNNIKLLCKNLNEDNKLNLIKELTKITPKFINPTEGFIHLDEMELLSFIKEGIEVKIDNWKKYEKNENFVKTVIEFGNDKDFKLLNTSYILSNEILIRKIFSSPTLYDKFLDTIEFKKIPENDMIFILNYYIDNIEKNPITLKRLKFFTYNINKYFNDTKKIKILKKNILNILKKNNNSINHNDVYSTYSLMKSDKEKLLVLEKIINKNDVNIKSYFSHIIFIINDILKNKKFELDFKSQEGFKNLLNYNKVLNQSKYNPIWDSNEKEKEKEKEIKVLKEKSYNFLKNIIQMLNYYFLNSQIKINLIDKKYKNIKI